MTGDTPLLGCSVLVVDDDFYLAEDARETLEEAGATVLGPYSRADEALGSLTDRPPEYAVLDLNLGFGPDFEIARRLKVLRVPVVFVTGYDENIIPPDLADTPCIRKPIKKGMLVAAVRELVADARVRS